MNKITKYLLSAY